jgi:hypothetical protein
MKKRPGPTGKAYPPPGGPGTVHWLRLATYAHNRLGVRVRVDFGLACAAIYSNSIAHTAKPPAKGSKPAALPCRPERCAATTEKIYIVRAVRTGGKGKKAPVGPEKYTPACVRFQLVFRCASRHSGSNENGLRL